MAMMMAGIAKGVGTGALGSVSSDLLGLKTTGALFIGILRSQTAQDRLVQQFDLKKVYGAHLLMDARSRLEENTSISEDRKSGIITLSVTDHSAVRATALAAAYVDQLNFLVAELSTSAAHRERVFLDERLKIVKQGLDEASNQLAQFSSKNATLDIKDEGKAMLDTAAMLAGQMIAAQSQLEGLRQIYTDSNPRVQSLNARVVELRRQLEKLSGSAAGKSGDGPEIIHASSGDLPYPSIRNLPLIGVKYSDYYRNARVQETVYELLTQQYELAKVEEAKETPSVKVLDPATIPEKKSFPPRLEVVLLGTFLACGVSLLWVLGATHWDEIDSRDPRKLLAQEITGTLKARSPWASHDNGNGAGSIPQKIWIRLVGRRPDASGSVEH
jgi:capsule polysaccharide export protein KpsE/RkpR